MSRTSLFLAALLVAPACDSAPKEAPKTAEGTPAATPAEDAVAKDAAPEAKPEATPEDPWKKKLAGRVLASSGLGQDGKLTAFDIVNCESGDQYCQVCKFGSSPKLMAVGSVDDEKFHEDLKNLDAIVQKYGDDKVKAFAVITEIVDGKGVTPKDVAAAQEGAKALREKLAISIPVVVPAPGDDGKANREWDEYYNITASRTVMFADGRNTVKWSGVAPEDWSGLNEAIKSVVEG